MRKKDLTTLSDLICEARYAKKRFTSNGELIQTLYSDSILEPLYKTEAKRNLEYETNGIVGMHHDINVYYPMFDYFDKSIKFVRITKTRISRYFTKIRLQSRVDILGFEFFITIKCPTSDTNLVNFSLSLENEILDQCIILEFYFDGKQFSIKNCKDTNNNVSILVKKKLTKDKKFINEIISKCFDSVRPDSIGDPGLDSENNHFNIFWSSVGENSFLVKYDSINMPYHDLRDLIGLRIAKENGQRITKLFTDNEVPLFYKLYQMTNDPWEYLNKYTWRMEGESDICTNLFKFLNSCEEFFISRIKSSDEDFIIHHLNEAKIELNDADLFKVLGFVKDCWFTKINASQLPFEHISISKIKTLINKIYFDNRYFDDRFNNVLKFISHVRSDILYVPSVTLNLQDSKIDLNIDSELKDMIIEKHSFHDPLIEYVATVYNLQEVEARKNYVSIINNNLSNMYKLRQDKMGNWRRDEIYKIKYIQRTSACNLFEILNQNMKDTQQVFNFMHAVLEPFYPSLHIKEEHDMSRRTSSIDSETYDRQIRDSIRALM